MVLSTGVSVNPDPRDQLPDRDIGDMAESVEENEDLISSATVGGNSRGETSSL